MKKGNKRFDRKVQWREQVAADGYENVPVVRLQVVREKSIPYEGRPLDKPEKAARFINQVVQDADREYLVACCVDMGMKPLSVEIVAIGSINQCLVIPREVFKNAVLSNAAYLFLFHNHPSGNTKPSQEDRDVTERIQKAGELLGIPLIDHIIIGIENVYSFREHGGLEPVAA